MLIIKNKKIVKFLYGVLYGVLLSVWIASGCTLLTSTEPLKPSVTGSLGLTPVGDNKPLNALIYGEGSLTKSTSVH